MKVFVAGATGVLGTAAVPLLLAAGHQVIGIARSPGKSGWLRQQGALAVQVDLFDPTALAAAMRECGAEAVVNLATRIPTGAAALTSRGWAENDRIRRQGSRALVDAALAAGVQRFVQEGVSFVYADAGDEWIDEDSTVDAVGQTRSALTATAAARRFGAESGGVAVALWFGLLYGDDPITRQRLDLARWGLPALFGSQQAWATSLHRDDAGAAVVAALGTPSGTYNVGDTPLRRRDQAAALAEATGRARVRIAGPRLVRLGGPAAQVLARSQRVSSNRFHAVTGWKPRYASLAEGLRTLRPAGAVP